MPSFRDAKRRVKIPGFHCHHVIPLEVVEKPVFANFFRRLNEAGFDYDDFGFNGMYLPCTEENALAFRLPLHRGPHPVYNEMVSERIAYLEGSESDHLLQELHRLQISLKTALRSNEVRLSKGRRLPFTSSAGFESMEIAAFRLWDLLPPL